VKQSDTALEQLVAAMQRGEFIYREGRIYRMRWLGQECEPRLADTVIVRGYRRVRYSHPTFTTTVSVQAHRVVWVYHNGMIPDGLQINHMDGDKSNNLVSNLELVTISENSHHRFSKNLAPVVLTPDLVREIRRLYATGKYNKTYVARLVGVPRGAVYKVLNGYSWGWLDE
jgi:hypothetical protein